ncbi:hypothetical protein DERP_014403 [Dermatophagoides pteronyssinus]|uniref:FHA domain-containing protein n=1 Tax=Dermatophagoides pteronyssinus TaxID=6956 RepID=A0ABQ8J6F7_DERPT|nr:hypothetical protein DERP_014403 [Dermatophagoides pteronyssinus]
MLPNSTSTNQIVHRPKQQRIVDRFSYLLRKCPPPGSSTTLSSSSVTFHPLINRVTRIGSGIQANLRIRDQDNIDTIHAEIHQTNDNPFNDYDNDHQYGQKFNILKTISCRKPTFLNDQLLNSGENRLLRHQDRLTFGGGEIDFAMNMDSNSSDNVDDNDDDDDDDKWKHYHEQVQEQQNDDDNEGQYLEQQQEQSSLMIDPKTMSMMNEHRFYTESIPSISIRMTTPSSIVWTPISQSNHQTTAAVTNENNQQNRINRRYPIEYLDIETPKKKCNNNNNKVLPMSLLTLNFNLTSSSTTTATTKIDHERKNLMTLSHDDNDNNDPETKFKQQQQIRIMDQTGLFLGLGKHNPQQQQQREIIIKVCIF